MPAVSCKIGGRRQRIDSKTRRLRRGKTNAGATESELDRRDVPGRAPSLGDERLLLRVVRQEVHRLEDGLLLRDGVLPSGKFLGDLAELDPASLRRVPDDGVDVLEPALDLPESIVPLVLPRVDGVERASHGLGHFADLGEELGAVGEDNEDVLARLVARDGVDEEGLDLGVVHVEVAAEDAPEDALEDGHPGSVDRARDELEVVATAVRVAGEALLLRVEEGSSIAVVVERGADLGLPALRLREAR